MYGNNYGYNPYYQQPRYNTMPQQPIEQPLQTNLMSTRNILNGKQVDSIDVVKAMDIPLDGSISYFPLADGTAIVTKQLQTDGTSKTVIFKPVDEEKTTVKYIMQEELKKSLNAIDLSEIDDLKEELEEIKKEIKTLKKKEK